MAKEQPAAATKDSHEVAHLKSQIHELEEHRKRIEKLPDQPPNFDSKEQQLERQDAHITEAKRQLKELTK